MEKKTGRNSMDVVMELVDLHFKIKKGNGELVSEEDIEKVYLKYYELIRNNR